MYTLHFDAIFPYNQPESFAGYLTKNDGNTQLHLFIIWVTIFLHKFNMGLSHHHYFPHPFPSLFKSACQNLLLFRYAITLPSWQSSPKKQSKIEKILFSRTAGAYSTSLRQNQWLFQ